MTLQKILEMEMDDIMRLKRDDLAKLTQTVAKNVERRAKNIEKNVPTSPALKSIQDSGGYKIHTKEKNLNQLRAEFVRGVDFLRMKTATVAGAKKHRAEMYEIASGGKPMTPSQEKEFWKALNKLTAEHGREIVKAYGSEQIFAPIRVAVTQGEEVDIDAVIDTAYKATSKKREFDYEGNENLSAFFEPES